MRIQPDKGKLHPPQHDAGRRAGSVRFVGVPATRRGNNPMTALLTYEDVCAQFKVSRRTVNRWVARGWLTPIQFGGRTKRFRVEDLEQFVRNRAAK